MLFVPQVARLFCSAFPSSCSFQVTHYFDGLARCLVCLNDVFGIYLGVPELIANVVLDRVLFAHATKQNRGLIIDMSSVQTLKELSDSQIVSVYLHKTILINDRCTHREIDMHPKQRRNKRLKIKSK